jgi:hypothetical protein
MNQRIAQCACGQLKAECSGEPTFVAMCHCHQCQRRTGSVFAVNAGFLTGDVKLEGRSSGWSRAGDSGRTVDFRFCPECGTTVYWSGQMRPDLIVVAVGAFNDPDFPAPIRTVWAQSKHEWVQIPPGLSVHAKGAAHAAPAAPPPAPPAAEK